MGVGEIFILPLCSFYKKGCHWWNEINGQLVFPFYPCRPNNFNKSSLIQNYVYSFYCLLFSH